MKKNLKLLWRSFEYFIICSPFFVAFLIIFHVPDSKHFFSRVVLLSSLYCAVRFYKIWKKELHQKKLIFFGAIIICCYFFLMQYLNDGNADFPTSILYVAIYFIFFPFGLFNSNLTFLFLLIASIFSGFFSYYEVFYLKVGRAGFFALNPIPYSYFSGVCLILTSYFILRSKLKSLPVIIFSLLSVALLFNTIILTQTRATLLAILVIFIFMTLYVLIISPSRMKFLAIVIGCFLLPIVLWQIPIVNTRVSDAINQVHNYEYNDYKSSTGIRIKLWESGLDIASDNMILGTKRDEVESLSAEKIASQQYPSYLGSFLIHPNANFHNQFIQVLVDSGIIGLLLICLFIFSPLIFVLKSDNHYSKVTGISIVVFTGICLFFDSLFLYNHTVILYSLVIMIFFGIRYDEKK